MCNNLILVGGGPFARQLLEWLTDAPIQRDAVIKGYLNAGVVDSRLSAELVCLGDARDYLPDKNDLFVCALLEPREKLAVCGEIRERGGRFQNFNLCDSDIPRRIVIGEGCLLAPKTGWASDICLKEFVTIQPFAGIGHDVTIGAGATIGTHCVIGGYSFIGAGAVLQPNVVVLPHVRIGEFSRIGAGSVVVRDIAPQTMVWGVPAKKVAGPIEAI